MADVEGRAAELPNTVVCGYQSLRSLTALAQRSDVTIMPYVQEEGFGLSLPNKVYDAMASGHTILTSLSGHLDEFLRQEGLGQRYSDEKDLIRVLRRLEANPSGRAQTAARARSLYDRRFSASTVYNRLVEHLEMMCGQGPRRNASSAANGPGSNVRRNAWISARSRGRSARASTRPRRSKSRTLAHGSTDPRTHGPTEHASTG